MTKEGYVQSDVDLHALNLLGDSQMGDLHTELLTHGKRHRKGVCAVLENLGASAGAAALLIDVDTELVRLQLMHLPVEGVLYVPAVLRQQVAKLR